jgi:hypothetical protein
MNFLRRRAPFALLAYFCILAASSSFLRQANAGESFATDPVRVTGPSPFADGCEGRPLQSWVYRNSVVEPTLAGDPRDGRHMIAAWVQDKIATAAASGVLAAVSDDGGISWTPSTPRFSRCAGGNAQNGGDYSRASDPWLAIARNGDVFASALAVNSFAGPETASAILVAKSVDGGRSWENPVAIARDPIANGFNDKGTITADPLDPQEVYAVWDRDFEADQTQSGMVEAPAYFSRTTDGGESWEVPRAIYSAPGVSTIGHILSALPNGDLVDIFARTVHASNGQSDADIALIRSADGGRTWSDPTRVASIAGAPLRDPFSSFPIQPTEELATLPSVALDSVTGRLHVVWQDARFSDGDHIDIAYSASADGGRSWSEPVKINATENGLPAFVPTVAVMPNGTVGVLYYDLRNTVPDQQAGIATDLWLTSCGRDCGAAANWTDWHVAGSFDLRNAPYGNGYFLGDYEGLVGTSAGFDALYAKAELSPTFSVTDAYFASLQSP